MTSHQAVAPANPQQEEQLVTEASNDDFEFIEFKGELPNMRKIEPITLEYRNITLKVPAKKGREKYTRVVLDDVRGVAAAGTFTAIMGPSGGGKTSLLNVLAGRVANVKNGEMTGELLIKDKPRDESAFKSVASYVMQDDILYSFLTVRETLLMASHFQLGFTLSKAQKEEYVSSIISVLGLTKAQNTIIGSAKVRGVSGGERKRVNIGVELIADPSILFMDEPTTGLDSFQALSVMSAIKNLTRNGRTVVASIHQPRSSIFSLFDMLHLLSEGRTVYFGPASEATAHFRAQGFPCPPSFNSADHFLDVISLDQRSPELEASSRERVSKLQQAWRVKRTDVIKRVVSSVPEAVPLSPKSKAAREAWSTPRTSKYRISWGTQFVLLLWRQLSLVFRNKFAIVIRVAMAVMFALVLGAIYSNRTQNQKSIQDLIGLLFGCVLNTTFSSMVGILNTFGDEKYIVQRERASKSYRLSSYFVAKVLSEIPVNMLAASVFSILLYWTSNLTHTPDRFFIFWATILNNTFDACGQGLFLASAAPNPEAANALAPLLNVSMMLLSGFYINIKSLPKGAQWCPDASFIRANFVILIQNEFAGKTYDCSGVVTGGCISKGEQVIENLSFNTITMKEAVAQSWIIAAVIYLLSYFLLRLSSPRYMAIAPTPPKTLTDGTTDADKRTPGADEEASPTEAMA